MSSTAPSVDRHDDVNSFVASSTDTAPMSSASLGPAANINASSQASSSRSDVLLPAEAGRMMQNSERPEPRYLTDAFYSHQAVLTALENNDQAVTLQPGKSASFSNLAKSLSVFEQDMKEARQNESSWLDEEKQLGRSKGWLSNRHSLYPESVLRFMKAQIGEHYPSGTSQDSMDLFFEAAKADGTNIDNLTEVDKQAIRDIGKNRSSTIA
ncbi:hypothetical protein IAR55_000023 [Kwoniella newhampshirensis]|uniref:Ribosome assembly protein 3 n=1 Tax=Kwoniella newhampshirensis TaxID=1651941 RepID=A0AAW0Z682_9TREE